MDATAHPYDALTPERILDAVEQCGVRCTGALSALNSYENRVYRVELEDGSVRVAKFYRPDRWSDDAILEEHAFAAEAVAAEIPAIAPAACGDGTLRAYAGFRYAVFPWQGGRAPDLNAADDYRLVGRYLGRLHAVGAANAFAHRPNLVAEFGHRALATLLASGMIPRDITESYAAAARMLLPAIDRAFAGPAAYRRQRVHGDFHLGNVLWTATGPHIVDFDDCMTAPAVQDLWMILSGERADMEAQLGWLLEGYSDFAEFDVAELALIEPLRALRLLRYAAWVVERWSDPAFPRSFPWFSGTRYWEDQINVLKEQIARLEEPPLAWRA